ncbi:UPF0223 protein [Enterococcus florum]|uniref:UPF0223 protein n=1 Tax=Enterococcus florum TaxID=2480627 RepID=A0A4P5PEH9_9ENTE|nr:UPF0223 family protein [Enterococcus florum]GCF94558.1 UPF0223 protein [Enterococcus florum]
MNNYSYPIDPDWTRDELVAVIDFLNLVEQANERGIETKTFLDGYQKFKTVVKSIGEEKRLGKEFESVSGYSLYRTVQKAEHTTSKSFKM